MPRKPSRDKDIERGKRFAEMREKMFGMHSRDKFAELIGVSSEGRIRQFESGDPIENKALMELLKLGVRLDWLLSGRGEMANVDYEQILREHEIETITTINDMPIVGDATADTSALSLTSLMQDIKGMIKLPENIKAVQIKGDSMLPVVLDGQYVLIGNETEKPPSNSIVVAEIYERDGIALGRPEHYCKRVIVTDGMAYFHSQSPTASIPIFSSNKFRLWPVLGVWFAGKGRPPVE